MYHTRLGTLINCSISSSSSNKLKDQVQYEIVQLYSTVQYTSITKLSIENLTLTRYTLVLVYEYAICFCTRAIMCRTE